MTARKIIFVQEPHWCKAWKIFKTKHKYLELETIWFNEIESWFNIAIGWTRYTDHAGFTFRFELMKLYFSFIIYDNRHWDFENKKWCVYEAHQEMMNEETAP